MNKLLEVFLKAGIQPFRGKVFECLVGDDRGTAANDQRFSDVLKYFISHKCALTPELSRAERGGWEPVLPACREVSTKPRHGVGLNDLLGGKEAGEGEATAHLPKGRSPDA